MDSSVMSVKSKILYLFVSCCYYVTSFFFVRPLLYKNKIFRHLIYNSINYNARTLIYSNIGSERYITDSRDQIIGRTLYLSGEYDFDKFLNALDIMRKHRRDFGIVELLVDIGANIGPIC